MKKTVVIDVVGLSASLIGEHTPFLKRWIADKQLSSIEPMLPAVTTAVQSAYVTGKWPTETGIVGNGWYDRTDCEIKFWKQSNKLVNGEKIWERARQLDPSFTVSKMFWWYNMYSSADFSVTPRPQYHADGVKAPDCYSHPSDLRDRLQEALGTFPLFNFWGPNANIKSTRWIADASLLVDRWHNPTLTLIYLPHLDYCLQKFGQDLGKISKELHEIDDVLKDLIQHYERQNAEIIILSEYGITNVSQPIHLNRLFREAGLINVRVEQGLELLDAGASRAFAVADHQVAHIYINDPACTAQVRSILEKTPGIELILDEVGKQQHHIDNERSGDFVVMADAQSWFTYYYWFDDTKAPDYARLVDIHRKPGYDPVEMFMDPANPLVKLKAGYKLIRKKLGFRYLMNVIPLDATLIKGSHGRVGTQPAYHPVFVSSRQDQQTDQPLQAIEVYDKIWQALTSELPLQTT
ncbi:alkaline phosphatase family protein [Larkinella harenae]